MNMPTCGECGEPMEISGVTFSCDNQHILEAFRSNPAVQQIEALVVGEKKGTNFPCVIDTDHIILAESEVKHEEGSYPYSVILVMRAKAPCKDLPFVTWMCAEAGGRMVNSGHYDMTLAGACEDYLARCKSNGLNPGKVFGQPEAKPAKKKRAEGVPGLEAKPAKMRDGSWYDTSSYHWKCPLDGQTECPSVKCWGGDKVQGCRHYDENGNACYCPDKLKGSEAKQ